MESSEVIKVSKESIIGRVIELLEERIELLEERIELQEEQIKVMEIALDRDEELIRFLGESLNFAIIRDGDIPL